MKYNKPIMQSSGDKVISAGRAEEPVFTLEVLPNGDEKLVKTGTRQIDDEIQSHVSLCDVKKIIERFTLAGEMDKLAAKAGYVDLTEMPKNLAETLSLINKGKNAYENLKPEIKQNFGSYEDFLATFANPVTATAFLNQYQTKKTDTKEVVTNAETEQK